MALWTIGCVSSTRRHAAAEELWPTQVGGEGKGCAASEGLCMAEPCGRRGILVALELESFGGRI